MHGKNSKFAMAALSALLYAQGLLGVAAVTMVVMKDRTPAEPTAQAILLSAASPDAQVR
jgi:hypothetical protein